MTQHQQEIQYQTKGRGFYELTPEIQMCLSDSRPASKLLCHLFILHTSASLLITENADPDVLADLERFFTRLVPDGDPLFQHTAEGPDDMPSHVRSALTQTALTVPIRDNRLVLGTWQGIYLWEHRNASHLRKIAVSFLG